jgi:hypothetical protein
MYLWLGLSEKRYRYSVVYTLIIYWDRSIADPFSLIKIIYQIGREYIIDVEIEDFLWEWHILISLLKTASSTIN